MFSTTDAVNITLFIVELLGAVCGNFLLLLVLYFSKDLHRSVSSNLIFNSAVIDSLSVIITIPLAMDYLIFQTGNLNGTFVPMIINSMFTFWMLLMQYSALLMIANRFMIIKYPSSYHTMATVKKARVAIGIMWSSVFFWTSVIYIVRGLRNPQNYSSPLEYMSLQHQRNGKYIVVAVSLISVLGNGVICAMVCRELAKYLRKKTELWKSIQEETTSDQAKLQRIKAETKRNVRSCNTVLIVLATFIMSLLPSFIRGLASLLDDSFSQKQTEKVSAIIIIMTTQFNSCLNPFILICRSTKHRQLLKREFNKLFRRNNRNRTVPENVSINRRVTADSKMD